MVQSDRNISILRMLRERNEEITLIKNEELFHFIKRDLKQEWMGMKITN